jgi:hypothetical protein
MLKSKDNVVSSQTHLSSIHSTRGDNARPEFGGFALQAGHSDLAFSSEAGNATVLAHRSRTSVVLERFDANWRLALCRLLKNGCMSLAIAVISCSFLLLYDSMLRMSLITLKHGVGFCYEAYYLDTSSGSKSISL